MSRFMIACSLVVALSSQVAGARSFASRPVADPPLGEGPPIQLDRATLRAELIEQRAANLARFHAYRLAEVYPSNTHRLGLLNVWRDAGGHLCAAATIIRASGAAALVDSIAEHDNFIKLADVTQGPVMDWILTSGFTQAELVMIQRPFRPVAQRLEIAPAEPVAIDATLRTAETRRLANLYREIEAKLIEDQQASIELAVDRLIAKPTLAAALAVHVDG